MSLLPLLFGDFPNRHQRDWISIFSPDEFIGPVRSALNQLGQLEKDDSITVDKDKFLANIDVQQFKPEEVTVKLTGDNTVTVEGKHEEQQDEHGFISRHFVRRYVLPEGCDLKRVQSRLSTDGVLSISAPKLPEEKQLEHREIPITITGPIKRVEQVKQKAETKEA